LDVCLNSRLVSLGSIGLDTAAGARNATITEIRVERHLRHGRKHRHVHPVSRNGHDSGNGNSNGNGKAIAKAIANANGAAIVANEAAGISNSSPGTPSPSPSPGSLSPRPHKHDAYTHEDLHRPTTRSGAIARHATHAFVHYAVLDTMLALLRKVGPDTLAVTHASTQTGLFAAFVKQTGITVLPGILDWDVPSVLVEVWTQCCVPLIIWQALSCGYHVIATLALSTTLWEVRSWDVDLFHAPWAADSLIDLWGKRWHQLFRVSKSKSYLARLSDSPAPIHHALLVNPQPPPSSNYPIHALPTHILLFGRTARTGRTEHVPRARPAPPRLLLLVHGRRVRGRGHPQAAHGPPGARAARARVDVVRHVCRRARRDRRVV
jgi:hypothetical protein